MVVTFTAKDLGMLSRRWPLPALHARLAVARAASRHLAAAAASPPETIGPVRHHSHTPYPILIPSAAH